MSQMKRDQSLLFTMVPEEDTEIANANPEGFLPTNKKTRPKFLNLKSNSVDLEAKSVPKPVTTPYLGQTSVCSTPLTELRKFVHQNPLSICLDPIETDLVDDKETPNEVASVISNKLSIKSSSQGDLSSIKVETDNEDDKPKNNHCKTITDPTFPVFNADGTVVSSSLYNQTIINDLETAKNELSKNQYNNNKSEPFKNFDSLPTTIETPKEDIIIREKPAKTNQEKRKSLTLPLKSLSEDNTDKQASPSFTGGRKFSGGVQLTPLMSRLSMLALEERSSGFGSQTTTPGDFRGVTPTQQNFPFPYKKAKDARNGKCQNDCALHKCVLFVCGQQDIVLTMLLREECCQSPEVINKLVIIPRVPLFCLLNQHFSVGNMYGISR